MNQRPTRRPPQRYSVMFLCRDGKSRALGVDTETEARRLFDDLAAQVRIMSVDLRDAQSDGSVTLLASTRDDAQLPCARCFAVIGENDGCLTLKGLPFCGACAQRIEDEAME